MNFLYGMMYDGARKCWLVKTGCVLSCVVLFLFFAATAAAQNPVLTVRFANPNYDSGAGTYSLDVEFQSDTPNQRLFGQNIRFFYCDNALTFKAYTDVAAGYSMTSSAPTVPNADSGPMLFSLEGPAAWANHAIQLTSPGATPVYISTTGWTKLYSVRFAISDSGSLGQDSFCPSVIWDLQADPSAGGLLPGCSGVVMTVATPEPGLADSRVQHFNWQYSVLPGEPYGSPVTEHCTDVIAGLDGERDGRDGERDDKEGEGGEDGDDEFEHVGGDGDGPKPDEDKTNWFSSSGCNRARGEKSMQDWLGNWLLIGSSLLVLMMTSGVLKRF